jgi:deoxyribodipyrimidine photo-lyase
MLFIYWFRKDLRTIDNRGLSEFVKDVSDKNKFSFLYIKNKNTFNYFGAKRISFLLECLNGLKEELKSNGFKLQIIEGKSPEVFEKIISEYKSVSVFCNEQVEPYCIARDNDVRKLIEASGGRFNSYTDTTIFALGEIKSGSGNQYKVFTPFKNQALNLLNEENYKDSETDLCSLYKNKNKNKSNGIFIKGFKEYDLEEEYRRPDKSGFLKGGRKEALRLLEDFYENILCEYKTSRDFPALRGTSLLSAHLHFGTMNIRECLRASFKKLKRIKDENKKIHIQTWISELLWREFYYNITFHNPRIAYESFKKEYDRIRWSYEETLFKKWCKGKTGFPIVDAGMRQLNKEGWMHNRVRMITAMFLTKDLMIDWRHGEKYFAEKLIDLDFSNNNGGWQWSASAGVDAQPYFRIFNPYLQSKKFDAEGNYIREYLPELRTLPIEFIHEPDLMNDDEQKKSGVIIGKDYPAPIVRHEKAREEVKRMFKEIREHG